MARLRKFDEYAADFARELEAVLNRYCLDFTPRVEGWHHHFDVTLKTGETLRFFFDRGELCVYYRGRPYTTKDLPPYGRKQRPADE